MLHNNRFSVLALLPAFALVACSAGKSSDSAGAMSPAEQRGSWGLEQPAPPPADADGSDEAPATAARPGAAMEGSAGRSAEPRPRAGLGTEFGETRTSHISSSPFSRADSKNPFATAALFY